MPIELHRGGRSVGEALLEPLAAWVGEAPYRAQLHPGDIGWHLRFRDDELESDGGAFLLWTSGSEPVAAGLADGTVLRTALAPTRAEDADLGRVMAEAAASFKGVETHAWTGLRSHLVQQGWQADLDGWVLLYKELTDADAGHEDPDVRPLAGDADIAARVEVQRSAFAPRSTFTAERWRTMAAGTAYDPRLDLVAWTPDGRPAAAATGWLAGPGRVGLLEPVGTHADHRRQGYGHRVTVAVMAALARAGASGVRVHTPAGNTAAVAAYQRCGMRPIDLTTDVVRSGA